MRNLLLAVSIVGAALVSAPPAIAQDFPTKPVRIIVPYGAGSNTDILTRMTAAKLSEKWGKAVSVENIVGAGGLIGTQALAKANGDGYTLGMVGSNYAMNIAIYKNMTFDPDTDLIPIVYVAQNPFVFVVNKEFPGTTLADVVAAAKDKPRTVLYGSPGITSSPHMAMEKLLHMAGIEMKHIPYREAGQLISDINSNRVTFTTYSIPPLAQFIKAGNIRPLAVSGSKRTPVLPDVPTADEAGVKGYSMYNWNGFLAPKGVDPKVVAKIAADIEAVFKEPEFAKKVGDMGTEIDIKGSKQFAAFIKEEIDAWKTVAAAAKIEPK